jgi:beta-aspartyl-peptidase (threonine type)
MKQITIAIHGGAGTINRKNLSAEAEMEYRKNLESTLAAGYSLLKKGGASLDAVELAVRYLEDCPLFNAGKGSVFTNSGTHEMDASIMNGKTLEAGAVAGVRGVRNPISLARRVMEKSGHVMLCQGGAEDFGRTQGIRFENEEYFHNDFRYKQWMSVKDSETFMLDHSDDKKFGTVGAVACDIHGNLAAATSTGGMTNKRYGRVGDSPVIGAGTYANNLTCAISCTGDGEYFLRAVVAYDVSCLMEYKGLSLKAACELVIHDKVKKIGGEGGLIAVDAIGNICLPFNSEGMYRAWKQGDNDAQIAIYKD